MIFPQRKGLPVQTGGGFPYQGDSPRKIGGPHTESKPERRFSPRRLLRRGRNAAAEARISGNINSAASGRKNAHSSNNFFLRYPPRAMRGGYRRFSGICVFRRGIAEQFPQRHCGGGTGTAISGCAHRALSVPAQIVGAGRSRRAHCRADAFRRGRTARFYKLITLYYNFRQSRRKNYITVLYNKSRSEKRRTV